MSRVAKVFIDESGDDNFRSQHKYLIIVAVTFPDKKLYKDFHQEILWLKRKWFGRLGDRLAIHAYEIFNPPKRSHWQILGKERVDFFREYTGIVERFVEKKAFLHQGVIIDKSQIKNEDRDWYSTAFCMALERLDGKLVDKGKVKIFAESRNPTKDSELFSEFKKITGEEYYIKKKEPVILQAKYYDKLIFLKKGKESGLDLADSIAYWYHRKEQGINLSEYKGIKKQLLEILLNRWEQLTQTHVEPLYKWPK